MDDVKIHQLNTKEDGVLQMAAILAGLNAEDLLVKLNTEERLTGLSVEEIERYLQKRK